MVRAPVLHDGVGALKRAAGLAVAARVNQGARPRGVRALHERVGDLVGQLHGPALGDLQHGAKALDEIQADHGRGHFRAGDKVAGEAAAAEVVEAGLTRRSRRSSSDVRVAHFPTSAS